VRSFHFWYVQTNILRMPIKRTGSAMTHRKSSLSSANLAPRPAPYAPQSSCHQLTPTRSSREHVADAGAVVGLPGQDEMPERGQFRGDCSQATAQARLG
jgi:hypothetical protein